MPGKKRITAEDLYALQFVEDPQISPDGKHIAFVKVTLDALGNAYRRSIWLAPCGPGDARARPYQFTSGAKSDWSPRWSPDGQTLAFVSARDGKPQIFLIGLAGGEARALTALPSLGGASNPVWSPDGKRIAFNSSVNAEERRREDSGKEDPPPATALEAQHRNELKEEAEKKRADPHVITRLPYRSGTEYHDDRYAHIYVVDVPATGESAKPYRLTDGEVDFSDIAWTANGRAILSAKPRLPNYDPGMYQDIVRFPAVGRRKPIQRLTRPGHEYFGPQASPDGKWIAVRRTVETGSFARTIHLAVMSARGGAARDLTLELDRAVEEFQWSRDSRYLYFRAGDRGDMGLYRVAVRGGRVEKVVAGRRMVLGFSLDRAGQLAFVACTPERPADLYHARGGGKSERRLTDFNDKLLAEREIAQTLALRYAAPDGRAIQGWYLKPIGFRAGRRYPLVVNMHGGPHVMWGPSYPSMWLEWQFHAARGYAVFYCNPRGSEGYGEAFSDAIHNDWGDHVMRDILAGVDRVVALGFVDPRRMALTGGSYAGYMTAWIVGHDQRFACAWSQRGVYHLTSFHGTSDVPQLIEREFDMFPFDDIEKAWRQSPLAYVRNIRTPLAIEHQDQDYRAPAADAEQLYAALKRLKRTVVFYRYPREGHEMSRSGEPHHRVDRLNRMVAWFDRYCRRTRRR
jgi:dipeptidyl aminopeptidase/acylaminoacyl peptidase